ncbi:MAG: hypothetical protein HKM97_07190, partial [Acidimicrobiia bacterium]|nr:hypothetical protein [Acidimicrobiia bacterium]
GFGTECATTTCPSTGACCIPPGDMFRCDEKIVELTMIWDGDQPIRIRAYDGDAGNDLIADIDNIQIGDEVTIGPLTGPNNVQWELFAAGTDDLLGISEFHRSCSDDDMDGPEDCGSRQGNGKDDEPDFINDWILEGLVDGSGAVLDCSLVGMEPCLDLTEDDCVAIGGVFQGLDTNCADTTCSFIPFDCDGKIVEMTMIWDGDQPVRIRAYDGDVGSDLLADIDNIQIGDEVTIGPLSGPNDSYWEIFEAGTSNLIGESKFHRSCSDSEMNGEEDCGNRQGNGKSNDPDLINDWILEGLVDEAGGVLDCSSMGLPLTGGLGPNDITSTGDPLTDLTGDGVVDFSDLLQVLAAWGDCPASCPEDLDGSGVVDFVDLLLVLADWQ